MIIKENIKGYSIKENEKIYSTFNAK
jgi:hypothetical protein